jgi:hypothetical protein
MYQNVRLSRTPKRWPPLGEMLMWPSPERGAVPLGGVRRLFQLKMRPSWEINQILHKGRWAFNRKTDD